MDTSTRPERGLPLNSLAHKMGLSMESLEELLGGRASTAIAEKLRISPAALQDFIDGTGTAPAMAAVFGVTVQTARDLRERVGREGAVGLIFGLCLERSR